MFSERSLAFYTIEAKKTLSEKRFSHSVSVAKKAYELAKIYGENENKAFAAGILHDITKEYSDEKQLKFLEQNGIMLSREQMESPKVLHSYGGAVYAKSTFGIEEDNFFNAIFYHTTGRENMSTLEKIIYISDMIADDRDYEGVNVLRDLAKKDLDAAVLKGLECSIKFVEEKGEKVLEDSRKAIMSLSI